MNIIYNYILIYMYIKYYIFPIIPRAYTFLFTIILVSHYHLNTSEIEMGE